MGDYDSLLITRDSNAINSTEFYQMGATVPDRTVAMVERTYNVAYDDYVVGGMAVMFFLLAFILFHSRSVIAYRLKNFFTAKRKYVDEDVAENASEAIEILVLTSISALSVSAIYLDDLFNQSRLSTAMSIPYWLYAAGFVAFFLFIYAKAWLYALVNWVFFDAESSKQWMRNYLFLTSMTAFVFYPIALVDVYANSYDDIVISSAILVAILYEMLLFYKLITNFKVKKYGYLLNILYFCTVELLPVLVLGHLTVWISDNFIVKNLLY
ncbi:MAG: DUF4271 domain-containing protein [Bacteroidaceae bacterium]|nr:DUF4271 domain-containing protein [Bacteroidaceae bacterium]